MSNHVILKELNAAIHKHEKAKKVLINLINRSRLRCSQRWNEGFEVEDLISNSNCLLIGKSGTGKTYLMETLSRLMDFPLLCIDATTLMPTSASGGLNQADVIKAIRKTALAYFEDAPRNKYYCVEEVIDQMVVFVDEIDKLGQEFSSSNWNKHTQTSFLTLFENKHEYHSVSWVFAGAFTDLNRKKIDKKYIGFNHIKDSKEERDIENEIIKYGMVPELVGRIHHIVELDELTVDDYEEVLVDIILPKKVNACYEIGIDPDLLLDHDFSGIIKKAHKSEQGIRMLSKEIDKLLIDLEFEANMVDGYKNKGKQKAYYDNAKKALLGLETDE